MSAKFKPKKTITAGSTTIEIGRRSGAAAFKITMGAASPIIVDDATLNDLADAADDTLDAFDSDPLLWQ